MAAMLFQKVFEAITWLVMLAQGTRFGVEWHVHHMHVTPDLGLPSFVHSFNHFIQQILNANSVLA